MDYLAPPMFDASNIGIWMLRMSAYLNTLGLHVYLAATKKSYLDNSNHIEANSQALVALETHLAKIIFLRLLLVIPLLQCGIH